MKLVVFWLFGVPLLVGMMLVGFSFGPQTAAARASEAGLVRKVTGDAAACATVVVTAGGGSDARDCAPKRRLSSS